MSTSQQEDKVEQSKALARKYMREGWGSRASVLHAIYDLFPTDLSEEVFLKVCCILDPLHAPAAAIYENEHGFGITACGALSSALASFAMVHGFKPERQGIFANFWEVAYKKIITNPNMTAEEKVRKYVDMLQLGGYGAYYQIVVRFKERLGSVDCFELRKPYCSGDPVSRECFKACVRPVSEAAGIAAEVILEYEQDPDSLKIGEGNIHLAELHDATQ